MLEKLKTLAQTRSGKMIVLGGALVLLAIMYKVAFSEKPKIQENSQNQKVVADEISPVTKTDLEKKKVNVYNSVNSKNHIDPEEEFVRSRRTSLGKIDELRQKLGGSEIDSIESALNDQMNTFANNNGASATSATGIIEQQLQEAIQEGNSSKAKRLQNDLQVIQGAISGNVFGPDEATKDEIRRKSIELARRELEEALRSGDPEAIARAKRTLLSLGGSQKEIDDIANNVLLQTYSKENAAEALIEDALLGGSVEDIEYAKQRLRKLGYTEEQIEDMFNKATKSNALKLLQEAASTGNLESLKRAIALLLKIGYSTEEIRKVTQDTRRAVALKLFDRALKIGKIEEIQKTIQSLEELSPYFESKEIQEFLQIAKENYAIDLFLEALEQEDFKTAIENIIAQLKELGYSDEEISNALNKARSRYTENILKKALESGDEDALRKAKELLQSKGFSQEEINTSIEKIKSDPNTSKEILKKVLNYGGLESFSDTKAKLMNIGYTEDELEKLSKDAKKATALENLLGALKSGDNKNMEEVIRKLREMGFTDEEIRNLTKQAMEKFGVDDILSRAIESGDPKAIEEAMRKLKQLGFSDEETNKLRLLAEAKKILRTAFIDGRQEALNLAISKLRQMGFSDEEIESLLTMEEADHSARLRLKMAIETGIESDIEDAIEDLRRLGYSDKEIQEMIDEIIQNPEKFLSQVLSTLDVETNKVAINKLKKLGYSEEKINLLSREILKEKIKTALLEGDFEEADRIIKILENTGLSSSDVSEIVKNILINELNNAIKNGEEEKINRIKASLERYTKLTPKEISLIVLEKRMGHALEIGDQAAIDKYTYELIDAGMPLEKVNQLNNRAKRMIKNKERKEALEKIKQYKDATLKTNYDYYSEKQKTAPPQTFPYVRFRAKFFRTQKLLPGYRITLVISEENGFKYKGVQFNKGDFIYGTAALSNSRLMVTITKLKNLPAQLTGYDPTDFQPGIYSESARNLWLQTQSQIFKNAMSQINSQASTISVNSPVLGSTITFLGNWFSSQLDESLTPIIIINGHELIFETAQTPKEGVQEENGNSENDEEKKKADDYNPYSGFGVQLPNNVQDLMSSFLGKGQADILKNYQNVLQGTPYGGMIGGNKQKDDNK